MNNEEKILLILERVQTDMSELKQGQTALEIRLDRMDESMQEFRDNQEQMSESLQEFRDNQEKMSESLQEFRDNQEKMSESLKAVIASQVRVELELAPRVAAALDGATSGIEKNIEQDNRVTVLEAKSEDHGNRISALEYIAKAK